MTIDVDSFRSMTRKLSNWKAPGPDGVVGFWFKTVSALHDVMTAKLQLCLSSGKVPLWMAKGRTVERSKEGDCCWQLPPYCMPANYMETSYGIFSDKI